MTASFVSCKILLISLSLMRCFTQYYERGFNAFIIDPFCCHEDQCFRDVKPIVNEVRGENVKIHVGKVIILLPLNDSKKSVGYKRRIVRSHRFTFAN